MHIPSERIRFQMLSEPSYIWFVPSTGSQTHDLLIKATGNVLKSIISGTKARLLCAVNETNYEKYLCFGLTIFDDPANPIHILKIQVDEEEHRVFWEVLKKETIPVYFFDELNQCIAYAPCRFSSDGVSQVIGEIGDPNELYKGRHNKNTAFSMDCLDFSINPSHHFEKAEPLNTIDLGISFGSFETWEIHNFSVTENHKFEITDAIEGNSFEQRVWTALETIFPLGIYRSPQVTTGEKSRELTDVLCSFGDNLILVESKSMSVFGANPERDMDRKISNLKKHINKALDQLEGGIKQIRKKNRIFQKKAETQNFDEQTITFSENQILVPHALVVVSEILNFGNWDDEVLKIIELSKNNHALFHVIDLAELMKLISVSNKPSYDMETIANAFDFHLSERFDALVETKSIFVRADFIP